MVGHGQEPIFAHDPHEALGGALQETRRTRSLGQVDLERQPDLGELVTGQVTPPPPGSMTCFVNTMGMGLQFAAIGSLAEELQKRLLDFGKQGSGPGKGTGNTGQEGTGVGGFGTDNTRSRSIRWVLQFTTNNGRDYLNNAWWISTMPGLALSLVLLSVGIFGDRLRDYLDPRSKEGSRDPGQIH